MRARPTGLPGVLLVEPALFRDERGYFLELWQGERYAAAGLPARFVQDNVSRSRGGVLRGLHFQHPRAQGKLVSVVHGEVWDVVVDIRAGSPTYGRWEGHTLSAENGRQLWIPPGFAHGFVVTSPEAVFVYKCTELYHAADEATIRWDDPELAIAWPVAAPILSARDADGLRLRDLPPERRPRYAEGA